MNNDRKLAPLALVVLVSILFRNGPDGLMNFLFSILIYFAAILIYVATLAWCVTKLVAPPMVALLVAATVLESLKKRPRATVVNPCAVAGLSLSYCLMAWSAVRIWGIVIAIVLWAFGITTFNQPGTPGLMFVFLPLHVVLCIALCLLSWRAGSSVHSPWTKAAHSVAFYLIIVLSFNLYSTFYELPHSGLPIYWTFTWAIVEPMSVAAGCVLAHRTESNLSVSPE